jgi:hypothetical protein
MIGPSLIRDAGAEHVVDAIPAATQFGRPFLRYELEALVQGLLERSGFRWQGVRHGWPCALQYSGIGQVAIDDTQVAPRITDRQAS